MSSSRGLEVWHIDPYVLLLYNVFGAQLLRQHPAVQDAQVVGVPSEQFGQEVCAFLIPRAGVQKPSALELRHFVSVRFTSAPSSQRVTVLYTVHVQYCMCTVLLKVRAHCVPNTYVLVHYTGTAGGVQGAAARALRRRVSDDLHREGAEVPARRAGHADTQAVRASLFCQRLILMFTRQSLLFCFSHAADL